MPCSQQARPAWSVKELASVNRKLGDVGVSTVAGLVELLESGANQRLSQAGLKTFRAETVPSILHDGSLCVLLLSVGFSQGTC